MTAPAAIRFCNTMRDTAVDRAEADWHSRRHEFSFGTRLQQIEDGALVVSVMRKPNGLYQPRWSLNGREISRPDAEDAVQRHLAQLAETA